MSAVAKLPAKTHNQPIELSADKIITTSIFIPRFK